MLAFAYARYSSDNQRAESIDAQLQAIFAYAALHGIHIVDTYIDEIKTARTAQRPAFQRMIAEADRVDAVLVHKLDRFARDRRDSTHYDGVLEEKGVKLISVLEAFDDSPESVILKSVLEGMAEYFSKNLSREVMKGHTINAQRGVWNGGKPPLGYRLDEKKHLVVDEETAPIIRDVFDQVAARVSYKQIAAKYGWRTHRVYETITNEKYVGVMVYNRRESKNPRGKRNNHRYKPEEEQIKVECPAIITREKWEEVQDIVKNRIKGPRGPQGLFKREYLLTGLMFCGECGGKYSGAGYMKSPEYVYYKCTTCKASVLQRTIEGFIIEKLKTEIFDLEGLVPHLVEEMKKRTHSVEDDLKRIRVEIKSTKNKIDRIYDAIEEGLPFDKDRLVQRKTELEDLKAQEKYYESRVDLAVDESQVRAYLAMHRDNLESEDFGTKRKTIETFVERIVVFSDRFEIDFKVSDKDGGGEPILLLSLTKRRA